MHPLNKFHCVLDKKSSFCFIYILASLHCNAVAFLPSATSPPPLMSHFLPHPVTSASLDDLTSDVPRFPHSQLGTTPLTATAPMPTCTMRIYSNSADKTVAENVKIGDPLTLDISIDEQDIYGLKAVDCIVRDGLGWGEQPLINSEG